MDAYKMRFYPCKALAGSIKGVPYLALSFRALCVCTSLASKVQLILSKSEIPLKKQINRAPTVRAVLKTAAEMIVYVLMPGRLLSVCGSFYISHLYYWCTVGSTYLWWFRNRDKFSRLIYSRWDRWDYLIRRTLIRVWIWGVVYSCAIIQFLVSPITTPVYFWTTEKYYNAYVFIVGLQSIFALDFTQ